MNKVKQQTTQQKNKPTGQAPVYVIAKDGTPLMPTYRFGKVRHLLKDKKAKVVNREPFTIQLLYETPHHTQELTMGIDPGYTTVGISVSTEEREVYASETTLRTDIKEKLATKKTYRRDRRSRKVRHRKARFNNRKSSKPKGWVPPTVTQKIESHINEVKFVLSILPVTKIVIETGPFDIQKIKNPEIEGKEYQNGPMKDFFHVREYVIYRDGHKCQVCGASGNIPLEVHHIIPRPKGSDAPDNLITVCPNCHDGIHDGEITLLKKPPRSYKYETMMNIMRYRLLDEIKEIFDGEVRLTYGADTKSKRIEAGLKKGHAIDALMISGNTQALPCGVVYKRTKKRAHNRQIHRAKFLKGGIRRRAQTDFEMFGFRLGDRVLFEGKEVFVTARRKSGYFKVGLPDGSFVKDGVNYKKLKLIERAKGTLTVSEQRKDLRIAA